MSSGDFSRASLKSVVEISAYAYIGAEGAPLKYRDGADEARAP
jgi:hypothetical protein